MPKKPTDTAYDLVFFPLEPFFEINPGVVCSGIDNSWPLDALSNA